MYSQSSLEYIKTILHNRIKSATALKGQQHIYTEIYWYLYLMSQQKQHTGRSKNYICVSAVPGILTTAKEI